MLALTVLDLAGGSWLEMRTSNNEYRGYASFAVERKLWEKCKLTAGDVSRQVSV